MPVGAGRAGPVTRQGRQAAFLAQIHHIRREVPETVSTPANGRKRAGNVAQALVLSGCNQVAERGPPCVGRVEEQ